MATMMTMTTPTAMPAMAGVDNEPLDSSGFASDGSTIVTASVVKMVPLRPMAVPFSGVCLHPASRAVMTVGCVSCERLERARACTHSLLGRSGLWNLEDISCRCRGMTP